MVEARSATNGNRGDLRDPGRLAVVRCEPTERDLEELEAFVRVAVDLGVSRDALTVATPHPSADWLDRLVRHDLGDLRFAPCSDNGPPRAGRVTAAESLGRVCPELHTTRSRGVMLSVCGAHADRLVLSAHQISDLCTRRYEDCPYRNGGIDEGRDRA